MTTETTKDPLPFFKWLFDLRDVWIGVYWNVERPKPWIYRWRVYVCLLPTVPWRFAWTTVDRTEMVNPS